MSAYLWIKSLHVIAVISWMAGLLYLPRLFVYHTVQAVGSPSSEMLKVMEYRLLTFIMTPAMVVVWLTGAHLAFAGGLWRDQWLWVKFAFVLAMTGVHFVMSAHQRAFAQDRNAKPQKFFRILNEIPTLFMIFIVILVIVRPF